MARLRTFELTITNTHFYTSAAMTDSSSHDSRSPESMLTLAITVLQSQSTALARSAARITTSFEEAVELLHTAQRIHVIGVGKSGQIARKIASTLRSVGRPSSFLHPVEAMHGDLGVVQNGDACIMISKSGTSAELVELLPLLKARHASMVALVGREDSYLAKNADIWIDASVERESDLWDIVPTSSTTVALALGDALAVALMMRMKFQPADFAHNHPFGQLGRNLTLRVEQVMHHGSSMAVCQASTTFRDAIICSSSKALGCVCVCDQSDKLQGIITDGDVRRALQSHDDIRQLTASDVMSIHPRTIAPETSLQEALAMMEEGERQISVMPVVNAEGRCVGLLRLHDILQVQR